VPESQKQKWPVEESSIFVNASASFPAFRKIIVMMHQMTASHATIKLLYTYVEVGYSTATDDGSWVYRAGIQAM